MPADLHYKKKAEISSSRCREMTTGRILDPEEEMRSTRNGKIYFLNLCKFLSDF